MKKKKKLLIKADPQPPTQTRGGTGSGIRKNESIEIEEDPDWISLNRRENSFYPLSFVLSLVIIFSFLFYVFMHS